MRKVGNTLDQLIELFVAFVLVYALYPSLVEMITSSSLPALYKTLLLVALPTPFSLISTMVLVSIDVIKEFSIENFFTLYFLWLVVTILIVA